MSNSDSPESSRQNSAFAQPLYRLYFPYSCLSTFGSWVIRFLLGWSAWDLTGSALWVGVVAAVMLVPTFVLSPVFGIVSDRINPRNGMLVTVSAHALISGVAGTAVLLGVFTLPWLVLLATVLGAVTAAHTPIRLSLIPMLVPRTALASAIGYSAITFNTSRIIGPAAGGWLVAHASTAVAYYAAMGLFVTALPFMLRIKGLMEREPRVSASFVDELKAGFSYARRHRGIRLIFGFTLVNGFLGRTVLELLPAVSGVLLDGDSKTLATLTSIAGAGAIVGGLIIARQGGREERLMNMVLGALVLGSFCLLPIHWLRTVLAMGVIIFLLSMITTMVGTATQALAQLLVANEYRGRVMSLWTVLAMGGSAVGALIMGALADIFGFPAVLAGFAFMAMVFIRMLHKKRSWLLQTEQRNRQDG